MNSKTIIENAIMAKKSLPDTTSSQKRGALGLLIDTLTNDKNKILKANKKDLSLVKNSDDQAFIDRLTLDNDRFKNILNGVRQIMELPDEVGKIYATTRQKSGITTSKVKIPLGIILMIYESRPNVTIDAAALSLKTSNVIILKGGSEIKFTNEALNNSIVDALKKSGINKASVQVLSTDSREIVTELLQYDNYIDLVIPRGSRRLLEFIRKESSIPVLMHLEGNCHVYVDKDADFTVAQKIAIDSKTQRIGTCNTAESLLIHRDIAKVFLPAIAEALQEKSIEIRGDKLTCKLIKNAKNATLEDWGKEYLAPIISIKVVSSLDEAISHINTYGSGHTDAIVTNNKKNAERFIKEIDSASVMVNTSTRFADGFEYGLGAEIGISTNKLHARGPVGQDGLLTYKWIVKSDGKTKGDIVVRRK